ncbi:hypothetical protein GCM10007897_37790 [Sphingobium jiangsuense]|uniref:Cytochrome c n=1 Tax=Sphingobium jiangsuense TaxID=870476 RepID=A0A7W6BGS4_9SPHN|nr:c-type cytochrome [Sphingobium jiangsuense]MBB3926690.1 cytochrome c [Sphingobium jiangsuense]GLT02372.1 hypothetical protein GCM10007897_37790 [Sphingobium jiangsuense]
MLTARRGGLPGAIAMAAAALFGAAFLSPATAEPPTPAEAGRKLFIRCVACHAVSADAPPRTGPHLAGIVGRKVASLPDFAYSDAMRAQSHIWDETQLDRWLQQPQAEIPGLCLPFRGFPKPEDRKALIAYLKHPVP